MERAAVTRLLLAALRAMGFSLTATIALELAAAWLVFRVRSRRELLVVLLAQVVTNPAVELLCLVIGWHKWLPLASGPWPVMLAAELAALVVEALLYRFARVGEHPWLMSCALNAFSFGMGLLLA